MYVCMYVCITYIRIYVYGQVTKHMHLCTYLFIFKCRLMWICCDIWTYGNIIAFGS